VYRQMPRTFFPVVFDWRSHALPDRRLPAGLVTMRKPAVRKT
jgi:hypothetical protein